MRRTELCTSGEVKRAIDTGRSQLRTDASLSLSLSLLNFLLRVPVLVCVMHQCNHRPPTATILLNTRPQLDITRFSIVVVQYIEQKLVHVINTCLPPSNDPSLPLAFTERH